MMSWSRARTLVVFALLSSSAVLGVSVASQAALRQVAGPPYTWPEAHGDPSLDGFSPDPDISTVNASSLGVQWMTYLGGDPYSSPVAAWDPDLSETLVYQATNSGVLSAFNASNGLPLWSRTMGTIHSTPLAEGSYLWVAPQNGGRIYKLDAATGSTVCSAPDVTQAHEPIGSSPTLATPPGGRPTVYIGANDVSTSNGVITAVNEADCTVDFQVASEPGAGTGGIWDFVSYGVSANGEGLVLYGTSDSDSSVYANDAVTGALVWRYTPAQPSGDYDVGSGVTISPPGTNGFADGVAYVESKYGTLDAIDLTKGTLIWTYQMDSKSITTPALSGTDLVVGSETDGVFEFNAVTGALIWHFADPAGMDASPAIVGPTGQSVVVLGDYAGAIDVISLASGSLLYQYQSGGFFVASPADANGNLILASGNGYLYDLAPGGSNAAPPTTAVTSPANSASVPNPNGNLTVAGSAAAATGVTAVNVAIESSSRAWWSGATDTWVAGPYPNAASLAAPGNTSTTWTTSFPVPASGGNYTVFASAVTGTLADDSAGLSRTAAARSTFTVQASTSEPVLSVTTSWVAPGGQVGLSGTGFGSGKTVALFFGNAKLASVTSTSGGSLPLTDVTIPVNAPFGPGQFTAKSVQLATTTPVNVSNSWTEFGDTSTQVADDPHDLVFQGEIGVSPNTFLGSAWSYTAGAPIAGSVDVSEGVAYFADQNGEVYAVNMSTGMTKWTHKIGLRPTVESTPLVTPGGLIVVTTTSGRVVALDANGGATTWKATLSGALTSATFAGGNIYVASSNGVLTALSATTGAPVWAVTPGAAITSSPAVDPQLGLVVLADASGAVTALKAVDGSTVWSDATGSAITASPIVNNGEVYVGSTSGSLYSMAEATGTRGWTFSTGAPITAAPAIVNSDVVVGSTNANVYVIVPATGKAKYTVAEPAAIVGVAGAGDFLAATTANGSIIGSKPFTSNFNAWLTTQGSALTSAPTVVNGEVLVAGQNDTVAVYTTPGSRPF